MADTARDWAALRVLLGGNGDTDISQQALRDALHSMRGYGNLYIHGGSTTISVSSGVAMPVLTWTGSETGVDTTASTTAGTITVTSGGIYLITASLTITASSASNDIILQGRKTTGASTSDLSNLCAKERPQGTAGGVNLHIVGLATLAASDIVSVTVNVAGSGSATITTLEGSLAVLRQA